MRADYKFFVYNLSAVGGMFIFTINKKRGSVGAINFVEGFISGRATKPHCASPPNVISNTADRHFGKQRTISMTKGLFIILLAFALTSAFGQSTKADSTSKFVYEMCVFRKAKPGHVIKNETTGIADTIVAFVSGNVREKDGPVAFTNISFTNPQGQVFGTQTDIDGNYKITLNKNTYIVKFFALAYNEIKIDKLKLGTGQMQEIMVDLGAGGGFYTIEVTFDHKPTEKELKAKEKELTDN